LDQVPEVHVISVPWTPPTATHDVADGHDNPSMPVEVGNVVADDQVPPLSV
jgi:hypothetical protein